MGGEDFYAVIVDYATEKEQLATGDKLLPDNPIGCTPNKKSLVRFQNRPAEIAYRTQVQAQWSKLGGAENIHLSDLSDLLELEPELQEPASVDTFS